MSSISFDRLLKRLSLSTQMLHVRDVEEQQRTQSNPFTPPFSFIRQTCLGLTLECMLQKSEHAFANWVLLQMQMVLRVSLAKIDDHTNYISNIINFLWSQVIY